MIHGHEFSCVFFVFCFVKRMGWSGIHYISWQVGNVALVKPNRRDDDDEPIDREIDSAIFRSMIAIFNRVGKKKKR